VFGARGVALVPFYKSTSERMFRVVQVYIVNERPTFQISTCAKCSSRSRDDATGQVWLGIHPVPNCVKLRVAFFIDAI
jgi:hypothetical protein